MEQSFVTSNATEQLMKPLILSAAAALATGLCLPVAAYEPIITMEGDYTTVTPAVQTIHILAGAAQTDGKIGMIIIEGKAGEGPGPSITHSKETKSWYVLEGAYEFHIGDQVVEGGRGTFISVEFRSAPWVHQQDRWQTSHRLHARRLRAVLRRVGRQDLARGPELGALERSYGVTRPAP